ncbi:MAG: 5-formyltetrahydrofolate cyclo-ligase [Clostridia bacterium]|nr:5-formyltetrahydrofolate cyclo-ligase [Clostridia bacterium]
MMKEELRYKLKIKRRYFQGVRRQVADESILYNFLAAYGEFESFFIYNSFGDEADTANIIAALLKAGKEVYLPRVEGENIVPVPYGKTVKGAFGIKEPEGQAYAGVIDITVIPLLAINEKGYRIGYGKGFYDRFLKNNSTRKVGLGYSFQIENFIEDEWDEPLDEFLTEKGIYGFGK